MKKDIIYVDVILPLPVSGVFTYSSEYRLEIGQRVIVQFGLRKLYSAIIRNTHKNKPNNYKVKPVVAVLDEPPIVSDLQLVFWEWISEYYMCDLGDVMNIALPSSLKLASESKIVIHSEFDGDLDCLNADEKTIVESLSERSKLTVSDLSKLIKVNSLFGFINNLIRKEIIEIEEELNDKFKEKKIRVLCMLVNEKELNNIKLTHKQQQLISSYIDLCQTHPKKKWLVSDVLKKTGFSRSILNALLVKKIFSIEERVISRLFNNHINKELIKRELTSDQEHAFAQIKQAFLEKNVCLLHGVTSSGKTEVYIELIKEQLSKGKQVLYLLPEIALTTQIINRLKSHFNNRVGVSHSHLNNSERVEVWKSVQSTDKDSYSVILGTRSSLFLPYHNLGLIIVDEEHESSFKQHHPAPRYHARDAAIYLSFLHKTKVLLGSATPAFESYYNAIKGKYSLVEMRNRFLGVKLPKIQIIDIRKARLKKQMKHQFSLEMINSMNEVLDLGKQVILFQNRRGYSPVLTCDNCSFTPSCKSCDVSLTFHKWNNQLRCHYCGYVESVPSDCNSCGKGNFTDFGYGTQQIEEHVSELFGDYAVKRMDYDTTRKKLAYEQIINDFEQGRIDILVGTQMVAKGLDFDNVGLVGILNADGMLGFADFRSYERAFSMMMQVAGRSGRREEGKVLIQTYDKDNYVFKLLIEHDYNSFISQQMKERKEFHYPPYNKLISITLKHKKSKKLDLFAEQLSTQLRNSFGNRVLGPEYPYISRIRDYYHKDILLKIERDSSFTKAKEIIKAIINRLKEDKGFRSSRIVVDIDPV